MNWAEPMLLLLLLMRVMVVRIDRCKRGAVQGRICVCSGVVIGSSGGRMDIGSAVVSVISLYALVPSLWKHNQ